ncbi:hypothetical protein TWF281_001775 [Arthrobotrys megalospora]
MGDVFFCVICGSSCGDATQIHPALLYESSRPPPKPHTHWLPDVRFISADENVPAENRIVGKAGGPYVTAPGRIVLNPYFPQPEIRRKEAVNSNSFTLFEGRISKYVSATRTDRMSLSSFFPLHQPCWDIFASVMETMDLQDHAEVISIFYEMANVASYDYFSILWPHQYGGIENYWRFTKTPSYYRFIPDDLLYFEANPAPTSCHQEIKNKLDDLDGVGSSGGVPGILMSLPDILPLPIELSEKVLSYLSLKDILGFQQIKCERQMELPNRFWKAFFHPTAELGYLGFLDADCGKSSSYFPLDPDQRAMSYRWAAVAHEFSSSLPSLRNRQRIWNICVSLINMIRDTKIYQELNLTEYSAPMTQREANDPCGLVFRALPQRIFPDTEYSVYPFDGVKTITRGRSTTLQTSSICISYIGEGSMRFVSGIRFLPSGFCMGRVGPTWEEKSIRFDSGNEEQEKQLVLWVAGNQHGLVDLAVTDSQSAVPQWNNTGNLLNAAVTRRFFRSSSQGINITSVYVGMEISRLAEIGIWSTAIANARCLDPQELFIQRNLWGSNSLLATEGLNLNVGTYYQYVEAPVVGLDVPPRPGSFNEFIYRPTRDTSAFYPLHSIYFGTEKVMRFTCWTNIRRDITAIEIVTKERESHPYLLGNRGTTSNDFLIDWENGEKIDSLEILSDRNAGVICGLELHTSSGRQFRLNSWPELDVISIKIGFGLENGQRIAGLYGRLTVSSRPSLQSLGVVSSTADATEIQATPRILHSKPENPQMGPPETGIWIQTGCVRYEDYGHFESYISLSSLESLTAYTRIIETPYEETSRTSVVGFLATYRDNFDASQKSLPKIWGQIADADAGAKTLTHLCEGEYIAGVELRYLKYLVGLKLSTSMGRDIYLGNYDEGGLEKTLALTGEELLVWEYNHERGYFLKKGKDDVKHTAERVLDSCDGWDILE